MSVGFERKRYEHISGDSLVEEPANTDLVGDHSVEAREKVGAWRWVGIQEHKDEILEVLKQDYVIDLGGSAGPFGYGSTIVDPEGDLPSLYDADPWADAIISSHTFEHIPDLGCLVAACYAKLRPGGKLITFVPSWKNVQLRADNWPYHCHTFCLSNDRVTGCHAKPLDTLIGQYFTVQERCHTADSGLYISAVA